MKNIFISTSILFLIIGCRSGSSDTTTEVLQQDVNMTIGTTYTVYSKDTIMKQSEHALVKISHKEDTEYSIVTLLSGEAQIIRKPPTKKLNNI